VENNIFHCIEELLGIPAVKRFSKLVHVCKSYASKNKQTTCFSTRGYVCIIEFYYTAAAYKNDRKISHGKNTGKAHGARYMIDCIRE